MKIIVDSLSTRMYPNFGSCWSIRARGVDTGISDTNIPFIASVARREITEWLAINCSEKTIVGTGDIIFINQTDAMMTRLWLDGRLFPLW